MADVWILASVWISLALVSTFISVWLGIATALSEFRTRWKEVSLIGLVAFFVPFFGCAAVAYYLLGWSLMASWLCGVALSITSVAVVCAVMLELGLNRTEYGKVVLGACFINDLGTVIALGLIFAPFTIKTIIFVVVSILVFTALPRVTTYFFRKFGDLPAEIETKYILLILFAMGALAAWAGSEAVLPAYIIGMVLAGSVGKNHAFIRRIRTLTFIPILIAVNRENEG